MSPHVNLAAEAPSLETVEQFSRAERGAGLVEQVYEQMCEALLLGRYSPASRLTIREIAAAMHVSATPVREALSRLISEGILQATATRAIVVPRLTVEGLNEIFDLRALLEGELAEAAATRIDSTRLAKIRALQEELSDALDKRAYKDALNCNARFHFAIYEAAGKPLGVQIVRGLWLRIGPTLHLNYPVLGHTREGVKRHTKIIDGIAAKDPAAVRAGIVEDVRGSQKTITSVMMQGAPLRLRGRKAAAVQ